MKFKTALIHIAVSILLLIVTGCSSSSNCNLATGNTPTPAPDPAPIPAIRKIVEVTLLYLDAVPIEGVKIDSDYPGLDLSNAVTNINGQFSFDATNIPDGTTITFTFTKDKHIIQSVTLVIGEGGIVVDEHTVLYPVETQGYIPFDSSTEGRVSDFFHEEIALLNAPVNAVVSPDGTKLYISDGGNQRIRICNLADGSLSTLAGQSATGYQNGTGAEAKFNNIACLTITKDGKWIYLADQYNHCIRKINTSTGEVSLFAGVPEQSGNSNGTLLTAKFYYPFELVFSNDESILYVCDTFNKCIRQIDMSTSTVTTLGTAFSNNIYGIAISNDGTKDILYVNASYQRQVYSMDVSTGTKTLIAGSTAGNVDGIGNLAKFGLPTGIAASKDNRYLYIADYVNSNIRKIDISTKAVTTLSGNSGSGYENGSASQAKFMNTYSLDISSDDKTLYIGDYGNNRIRSVDTQTGETRKIAGGGRGGYYDGPGGDSTFSFSGIIFDVELTSDGKTLYATDLKNIWEIDIAEKKCRFVAYSSWGGQDAINESVAYNSLNRGISQRIILSKDEKTIYMADATGNRIIYVDIETGQQISIAGNGTAGFSEGTGEVAMFNQPDGLALSNDGSILYITDSKNNRIRKVIINTGEVTTIAGSSAGYVDEIGTSARFNLPTGIVISPDGNYLYIADSYNYRVRKLDLTDNAVTTIAGGNSRGFKDGIGTDALFNEPRDVSIQGDGTALFVSDFSGANLRRIDLNTLYVSSIAGGTNIGFSDGTGANAMFASIDGVCISRDGSVIYVADKENSMLRMIVGTNVKTYGTTP